MGLFLHSEPLLGLGLLPGDALPHFVHQDFAAPARNAVQSGAAELADHRRHRESKPLAKEDDLGRGKSVNVDRVVSLDVPHQIEIPLERDIRIVPALEQDLDASDRFALLDLGPDLLEAQDVALVMLGTAIERAELAISDTDIGVVDIPVDDVGDHVFGVLPPPLGICQLAQLQKTGPLVEFQKVSEFT
jgi:hypothetical protein